MNIVDTKFCINRTINSRLKCELVSYPKWIKFLGRKEFKDKTAARKDVKIVKFYFLAKKGGLAKFEFDSIHVFENGLENSIKVPDKVLVLPGLKFRLRILPVLEKETATVIRRHNTGELVEKTRTVHYYSGLEINYQKFQPIPNDFDELIKELISSSDQRVFEPLKTQLENAGLLDSSYGFGDVATELLTKNKDLILGAIDKANSKSNDLIVP